MVVRWYLPIRSKQRSPESGVCGQLQLVRDIYSPTMPGSVSSITFRSNSEVGAQKSQILSMKQL